MELLIFCLWLLGGLVAAVMVATVLASLACRVADVVVDPLLNMITFIDRVVGRVWHVGADVCYYVLETVFGPVNRGCPTCFKTRRIRYELGKHWRDHCHCVVRRVNYWD